MAAREGHSVARWVAFGPELEPAEQQAKLRHQLLPRWAPAWRQALEELIRILTHLPEEGSAESRPKLENGSSAKGLFCENKRSSMLAFDPLPLARPNWILAFLLFY